MRRRELQIEIHAIKRGSEASRDKVCLFWYAQASIRKCYRFSYSVSLNLSMSTFLKVTNAQICNMYYVHTHHSMILQFTKNIVLPRKGGREKFDYPVFIRCYDNFNFQICSME